MSELQQFIAMLERAGIGHGTRSDFNPAGTGVQVEHENDAGTITDWWFDDQGRLREVHVSDDGTAGRYRESHPPAEPQGRHEVRDDDGEDDL